VTNLLLGALQILFIIIIIIIIIIIVHFGDRVFPANHLAMVLMKQTYNNQEKYKKPKDIHKKPQKLNLTKPN